MIINKSISAGFIFIIFALAIVLRIQGINKYDLWFDEIASDGYSSQLFPKLLDLDGKEYMLERMGKDGHSPFYYALVYAYSILFGNGKSLRIISLLFSLCSLAMFYKLARLFLGRQASIFAFLIAALSPFQIWYAQEARGYAMAFFLATVLLYFYAKSIRTNYPSYWLGFSAAGVLGIYSNYYFVIFILFSGVIFLFKKYRRTVLRNWAIAVTGIFILFLPFLFIFCRQLNFVKNFFWLLKPVLSSLPLTVGVFVLGYSASQAQLILGSALFILIFIYGAYRYYRSRDKEDGIILFSFAVIPIILIYIFSLWIMPLYLYRQLIIFSPFYYLFIGYGIAECRNKALRIFLAVLTALFLCLALVNYYRGFMIEPSGNGKEFYPGIHLKKNYASQLAYIYKKYSEGYAVVATDIYSALICKTYSIVKNGVARQGFMFYPAALSPHVKAYLLIETPLFKNSIFNHYRPYILCYRDDAAKVGRYKHVIEPLSMRNNKNPYERVILFSATFNNKRSGLDENSIKCRELMNRNFIKEEGVAMDGLYIESYIRKHLP
ncbi:MAG: glycosyltransferase family 39 protein [Candidatus Omnitrophota bacterium]|jgi:uncharacterized membrane protein